MMGLEYAGLQLRTNSPIPLRSPPRRHRCRHLSARRKRDVVRRSPRGLLLHSCALERWPRITVQECRKRPARHSVRAARYKRCREPAPLFPTFAINYLSFCWWPPIPSGTSAPCFKCETSHYNKENLSRVSYLRMNKTLLQIRSDYNIAGIRWEKKVIAIITI